MINPAKVTIISGVISKSASIVLTTISIPMMIAYFGTHDYGSLTIIASLVSTMQIISLCAGGTVSVIGPQLSSHKTISLLLQKIFRFYAPYLLILSLIAFLFCGDLLRYLIGQFYYGKINGAQFESVFLYSIIALLVGFVSLIFQNSFYSMNKVYYMNMYQLLSNLATFSSLLLVINLRLNIASYSLFVLCGTSLVCVVMMIHYYSINDPKNGSITEDDKIRVGYKNISATALLSTLVSIIAIAVNQTDSLIIPYYLDNESLVMFTILFRVVTYEMLAYSIISSSVMPSIGRWFASTDWISLNKTYSMVMTSSTYIGLLIGVFNIFFLKVVVNGWLHKSIQIDDRIILLLSLYCCASGVYSSNYIVYSCFNIKRKLQMALSFVEPIFKIMVSYLLISRWGVIGAASSVCILAIFVTLPLTTYLLKHLSGDMISIHLHTLLMPVLISTATLVVLYLLSMTQTALLKSATGATSILVITFLFYRYLQRSAGFGLAFWKRT